MNDTLLKEYAELDAKCRVLEDAKDILRSKILEGLMGQSMDHVKSEHGSFTVCVKRSWTYSPSVKKLEEKVKIAKDTEQKKGIATPVVNNYLLYKNNK